MADIISRNRRVIETVKNTVDRGLFSNGLISTINMNSSGNIKQSYGKLEGAEKSIFFVTPDYSKARVKVCSSEGSTVYIGLDLNSLRVSLSDMHQLSRDNVPTDKSFLAYNFSIFCGAYYKTVLRQPWDFRTMNYGKAKRDGLDKIYLYYVSRVEKALKSVGGYYVMHEKAFKDMSDRTIFPIVSIDFKAGTISTLELLPGYRKHWNSFNMEDILTGGKSLSSMLNSLGVTIINNAPFCLKDSPEFVKALSKEKAI